MQTRYTQKMGRLLLAARHPLVRDGRGWAARRAPAIRNRQNSGMVTVHVDVHFSGSALNKLIAGDKPELEVTGAGATQRLKLTAIGLRAIAGFPAMCIKCGCTEDRACAGGCSWVARDVCSACVSAP